MQKPATARQAHPNGWFPSIALAPLPRHAARGLRPVAIMGPSIACCAARARHSGSRAEHKTACDMHATCMQHAWRVTCRSLSHTGRRTTGKPGAAGRRPTRDRVRRAVLVGMRRLLPLRVLSARACPCARGGQKADASAARPSLSLLPVAPTPTLCPGGAVRCMGFLRISGFTLSPLRLLCLCCKGSQMPKSAGISAAAVRMLRGVCTLHARSVFGKGSVNNLEISSLLKTQLCDENKLDTPLAERWCTI